MPQLSSSDQFFLCFDRARTARSFNGREGAGLPRRFRAINFTCLFLLNFFGRLLAMRLKLYYPILECFRLHGRVQLVGRKHVKGDF